MSAEPGKPVVLVVDDEPIIRMYAALIAEVAGYETLEAATADEALAILAERQDIRVVFTDVEMPGSLNGLELVEVIREKWPPIELIVASGRVEVDPQKLPERTRFFKKPYTEHEVLKTLRAIWT